MANLASLLGLVFINPFFPRFAGKSIPCYFSSMHLVLLFLWVILGWAFMGWIMANNPRKMARIHEGIMVNRHQ